MAVAELSAPPSPARGRLRRLWAPVTLLCVAGAFIWVIPWPCPMRYVLGIPCPSCGLTRAARAALSLHFAEATRIHPLWFMVLPTLGAWLLAEVGAFVVRGRALGLEKHRAFKITAGVIVGALVWLWIARFFGAFGGPVAI